MSWTNRAPMNPPTTVEYREPPRDTTPVRVRSRSRAYLLAGQPVPAGEWREVPAWVAEDLRYARGDDIEIARD